MLLFYLLCQIFYVSCPLALVANYVMVPFFRPGLLLGSTAIKSLLTNSETRFKTLFRLLRLSDGTSIPLSAFKPSLPTCQWNQKYYILAEEARNATCAFNYMGGTMDRLDFQNTLNSRMHVEKYDVLYKPSSSALLFILGVALGLIVILTSASALLHYSGISLKEILKLNWLSLRNIQGWNDVIIQSGIQVMDKNVSPLSGIEDKRVDLILPAMASSPSLESTSPVIPFMDNSSLSQYLPPHEYESLKVTSVNSTSDNSRVASPFATNTITSSFASYSSESVGTPLYDARPVMVNGVDNISDPSLAHNTLDIEKNYYLSSLDNNTSAKLECDTQDKVISSTGLELVTDPRDSTFVTEPNTNNGSQDNLIEVAPTSSPSFDASNGLTRANLVQDEDTTVGTALAESPIRNDIDYAQIVVEAPFFIPTTTSISSIPQKEHGDTDFGEDLEDDDDDEREISDMLVKGQSVCSSFDNINVGASYDINDADVDSGNWEVVSRRRGNRAGKNVQRWKNSKIARGLLQQRREKRPSGILRSFSLMDSSSSIMPMDSLFAPTNSSSPPFSSKALAFSTSSTSGSFRSENISYAAALASQNHAPVEEAPELNNSVSSRMVVLSTPKNIPAIAVITLASVETEISASNSVSDIQVSSSTADVVTIESVLDDPKVDIEIEIEEDMPVIHKVDKGKQREVIVPSEIDAGEELIDAGEKCEVEAKVEDGEKGAKALKDARVRNKESRDFAFARVAFGRNLKGILKEGNQTRALVDGEIDRKAGGRVIQEKEEIEKSVVSTVDATSALQNGTRVPSSSSSPAVLEKFKASANQEPSSSNCSTTNSTGSKKLKKVLNSMGILVDEDLADFVPLPGSSSEPQLERLEMDTPRLRPSTTSPAILKASTANYRPYVSPELDESETALRYSAMDKGKGRAEPQDFEEEEDAEYGSADHSESLEECMDGDEQERQQELQGGASSTTASGRTIKKKIHKIYKNGRIRKAWLKVEGLSHRNVSADGTTLLNRNKYEEGADAEGSGSGSRRISSPLPQASSQEHFPYGIPVAQIEYRRFGRKRPQHWHPRPTPSSGRPQLLRRNEEELVCGLVKEGDTMVYEKV